MHVCSVTKRHQTFPLTIAFITCPKSFEDVRTYNGITYTSFVEACHAHGIASNDNEWRESLN